MEDYLNFMKTLRYQMNDMEDQAAKLSAEEQMQMTLIQTSKNDIASARSGICKLKDDIERMSKEKGEICSQILEKQKVIAALKTDSATLAQSLELIEQERTALSATLMEKRTFYQKITEETNLKLQQQLNWIKSRLAIEEAPNHGKENDKKKDLMVKLDGAKTKLNEISNRKSELALENKKLNRAIEQINHRAKEFEPVLLTMDIKALEEENNIISSDKAGLTEYLQSLQDQIEKLKGISHVVQCACGKAYEVGAVI